MSILKVVVMVLVLGAIGLYIYKVRKNKKGDKK